MKQRPRIYYTQEQKTLMWDRWQKVPISPDKSFRRPLLVQVAIQGRLVRPSTDASIIAHTAHRKSAQRRPDGAQQPYMSMLTRPRRVRKFETSAVPRTHMPHP